MRRFAVAGMAALAIAASTGVYAQRGWFREHMQHMRMSPEDRAAMLDARIAAVHAGLKLSPDQDKLWPPVESAVRDFAKMRMDRMAARMRARGQAQDQQEQNQQAPDDPVARLRQRAETMATSAAGLKRIADAADPLYKSLDDNQKRRLAMLTRGGGRFREGWMHRWMDRGGREGPSGRDWDRGRDSDRGRDRDRDSDRDRDEGPERL